MNLTKWAIMVRNTTVDKGWFMDSPSEDALLSAPVTTCIMKCLNFTRLGAIVNCTNLVIKLT
jgi:hypothetical protein